MVHALTICFFADDSLFLCKANCKEGTELAKILKQYGHYSGQLVNYTKSSISFGSSVFVGNQTRVKALLNIPTVGGCGKYLGLPEYFGRQKRELFRSLVTKVKDRTNGWHNKFLSPGGKEVLIKSVALAMPVYPMNFFKLPVSICDDIDNVLSKFWWGTTSEKKRMSWFKWNRLTHPDSLLARTLKSRYYPNTSFLDASFGIKPSFGWSSMLHGKEFLQKGLRWHIGEGRIPLWSANWIPSNPSRPATNVTQSDFCFVHDLWSNQTWDQTKLQSLSQVDQDAISPIYIPKTFLKDKLIWHYSRDGDYSVKSAYHFASTMQPIPAGSTPPQVNLEVVERIWKLPLPSKQKHFLWRACTSSLSTRATLVDRGLNINPLCPRCSNAHPETANHILFTCPHAHETWATAQFPPFLAIPASSSLEDNLQVIFQYCQQAGVSPLQRQVSLSLTWQLWKSRNEFVFNNKVHTPAYDLQVSMYEAASWIDNSNGPRSDSMVVPLVRPSLQSLPVPRDWYKCNYDASFLDNHHLTRVGWILCDSADRFVFACSSSLPCSSTSLQAEGYALLHALQHLWIRGIRNVILEGDCEQLVNLLTGVSYDINMINLLSDITFWMNKFTNCRLTVIRRQHNKDADQLAHQADLLSLTCCIFSSPLAASSNSVLEQTL